MASGNSLVVFHPHSNEPPLTNFATLDTRNNRPCLDFDDAADESAIFSAVLPRNYAGGGITVDLQVAFTSATANEARFDVAFERVGAAVQDMDADGFATAKSVDITAPGTSGHIAVGSIAFSNGAEIDSLAVGEQFRIKVTRDANHANDDAAGDCELVAVELKET